MIRYELEMFPELFASLNKNFNVSKLNACETYSITNESRLCKKLNDDMFCSYDLWEYNPDSACVFYEESLQESYEKRSNVQQCDSNSDFLQYAYAAFKLINAHIVETKEQKCWRLLRIIYGHSQRVSVDVAAMCVNQLLNTEVKSCMQKSNNNKKVKSVLKQYREAFSLMLGTFSKAL